MNKIWQDYETNKDNITIQIKCKISIYEDIPILSFSYPFLLILEAKDEAFVERLEDNSNYLYVGYRVRNKNLDLYVYLAKEEDAKVFEGNTYSLSEDHGWKSYYQDLYPDMQEWQSIENLLLCQGLEDKAQVLRHKLTFQSEYKKASLIEDLEEEEGFEIEEEFVNNQGYNGLYFTRKDKVDLEEIEVLTLYLKKFLKIYDALYEGWEIK